MKPYDITIDLLRNVIIKLVLQIRKCSLYTKTSCLHFYGFQILTVFLEASMYCFYNKVPEKSKLQLLDSQISHG